MQEPIYTVAFIGSHGAGKTTLGRKAARKMGVCYHMEIGRELREEMLAKNAENHALKSQPEFDKEVIQAELSRDLISHTSRIVETWHPGNLAYAYIRSPEVAEMYEKTIIKMIQQMNQIVLVQPLRISLNTGLARLSEPGCDNPEVSACFFNRVAHLAEKIANRLNLTILKPIYTDVLSEAKSLDAFIRNLSCYELSFMHA